MMVKMVALMMVIMIMTGNGDIHYKYNKCGEDVGGGRDNDDGG